jgi:hypothetical protein
MKLDGMGKGGIKGKETEYRRGIISEDEQSDEMEMLRDCLEVRLYSP